MTFFTEPVTTITCDTLDEFKALVDTFVCEFTHEDGMFFTDIINFKDLDSSEFSGNHNFQLIFNHFSSENLNSFRLEFNA